MTGSRTLLALCLLLLTAIAVAAQDFDHAIAPVLVRHCLDCHSGAKPKGELDLTRRKSVLDGGKSGPALVPGKPEESLLYTLIASGKMPPKKPLPTADRESLRAWIAGGASWGSEPIDPFRITTEQRAGYDWWSLRPVKRPALPPVARSGWARNPVDPFILAKLHEKGLQPSPKAEARVLVRRLYFDLIGLPPPLAEIDAFVRDSSEPAYQHLVDRLLASPHYGERWARHWLDIVRYGESDGFERNNPRPNAWPYRDWVVAALNRDLPYDEFARLQMAGDVLHANDLATVRATGFLVAGIHNTVVGSNEVMREFARQDELEEQVAALGQTFLGLTVHCARCHDHKFDPVGMADYYRLVAVLAGVGHGERKLVDPAQPKTPQTLYVVKSQPPPPTHLLERGDVQKQLARVPAGGIRALGHADFGKAGEGQEGDRRRAFAEWVTRPDNPLFARVIVNRLWHYHFGTGLVETPSDLGFNGGRPSHPELLDWLAAELVEQRYSLKALHRLLVTSATYRQTAAARAQATAVDAGNRLLWRANPRRLEAEALRDAILATAGRLNPTLGGAGFQDVRTYFNSGTTFYEPLDPVGHLFERRTLYRFSPRGERSALLETFDCPDPSATTPRRPVTTTPLQALALLNNSFVLRMADHFAARISAETGGASPTAEAAVARAYFLAFGRVPTPEEARRATAFTARHGLPALCRVLLNSTEFVVIE